MEQQLKKTLTEKMEKALAILDKEFKGLRTGRASVNLLDPVVVEAYGDRMPLSQVATIATPDATTITVQVWDKEMAKKVEKAIADANLGLNPNTNGQLIRVNLPPLSEERRKELVKIAYKYAENTKIALRNIRREGMDQLKAMEKDSQLSKDELFNDSTEVQTLTDEFINQVDQDVKQKEQEILKI